MTVLIPEAAALVGVEEATIRQWIVRGYLTPTNPGRRPSRFLPEDVWRCRRDRMSGIEHARLDSLWVLAQAGEDAATRPFG